MAEEHKCQTPPEGHRLCANNCGFFGSPATLNLCSKCYRDLHLNSPTTHPISPSPSSPPPLSLKSPTTIASPPQLTTLPSSPSDDTTHPSSPSLGPMRCGTCRKRVGLTGFRCRCGNTFCGAHRHPEQHTCGFDFKSMGKDAIARANPIVKAMKLHKI